MRYRDLPLLLIVALFIFMQLDKSPKNHKQGTAYEKIITKQWRVFLIMNSVIHDRGTNYAGWEWMRPSAYDDPRVYK